MPNAAANLLTLAMPLALATAACDIVPKRAGNDTAPADAVSTNAVAASDPAGTVAPPDPARPTADATTAPVATPAPTPSDAARAGPAADDATRIAFPPGGTAVTLAGTVNGAHDRRYALDAQGGQRMRVAIAGASDALRFAVYPPSSGPGGEALTRGATGRFAANLPQDGRYLIQVYRSAGDVPADYRLSVAIDPPGSAAPIASRPTGGDPAAIVRSYYRAIDRGDYRSAYRLWQGDGQASGKSFANFSRGFAETRGTSVRVTGPARIEGAAGSLYATLPVAVDATLADGTPQRFAGSYVLRRVDDVPGSNATERSWHLYSAKLKPAG